MTAARAMRISRAMVSLTDEKNDQTGFFFGLLVSCKKVSPLFSFSALRHIRSSALHEPMRRPVSWVSRTGVEDYEAGPFPSISSFSSEPSIFSLWSRSFAPRSRTALLLVRMLLATVYWASMIARISRSMSSAVASL